MNEKEVVKQNGKSKNRSNRSTKSRSKDRSRNPKSSDNREICKDLNSGGRDNDPNWYFLDGDVARQASAISFSSYIGEELDLPFTTPGTSGKHVIRTVETPSIMSLHVNPCPGKGDRLSGINMASLQTYTQLSSLNAKTTNYAPQDLTMLMLAMGEIVSVLEHIRRVFGIMFTYNQRNRTIPQIVVNEMGFDYDDMAANLADYRLQFNTWITAVNKIPFLDNIAYVYKCADMYQKVYMDSESNMSQLIFMMPYSTWKLNEAYNDQGSGLETVMIPERGSKWNKWVPLIDSLISGLLTSATFNYIYSDVLNLASKTGAKTIRLDYLTEDYAVVPEYNQNFLLQVHNATIIGPPKGDGVNRSKLNDVSCNVDLNAIEYMPIWSATNMPTNVILDFPTSDPSVEDIIEATRYTAVLKNNSSLQEDESYAAALPDHYIVAVGLVKGSDTRTYTYSNAPDMTTGLPTSITFRFLMGLSQVDWAPLWYLTNDDATQFVIGGDLNYYTSGLPWMW